MYNFDPYNVLLSISTDIPVLLMTASVLQGHVYSYQNDRSVYCVSKWMFAEQEYVDIYLQRVLMLYVVDPFK